MREMSESILEGFLLGKRPGSKTQMNTALSWELGANGVKNPSRDRRFSSITILSVFNLGS